MVSTNSIAQGEQPAVLWTDLAPRGVKINFAHRTFRWTSEARGAAAVHCVVIGFALHDRAEKLLFDYADPAAEPQMRRVGRINPYLVDAPLTTLANRRQPLCDVPPMGIGNKPIDGGNYLFTDAERQAFLFLEPATRPFFRPWIGADEFINGPRRWCLWLGNASPGQLRAMPMARARVDAVRTLRRASKSLPTHAIALTPTRFHVENMSDTTYLVVPSVSSERRPYIPMDFEPPETLSSNLLMIVRNATPYHFGVLTSLMHMAWTRAVCGRLKSDYRYSAGIVYNNFPWPSPTPEQRTAITTAAEAVLIARSMFPGETLANLYDPTLMPPDLARAHRTLDRAVDAAYQRQAFANEAERLTFLFERHQELSAPLAPAPLRGRRAVNSTSAGTLRGAIA